MDPLTKILEMAGVTPNEKKEYYVFIAGDHNSGKTRLVQSFYPKDPPKPAKSTFGYEFSSILYQSRIIVNIVEVNETNPDNIVLKNLVSQNIDKSVFLFVFDIRHPNRIDSAVERLVKPFFEETLSDFKEKDNQKLLQSYYSTIASSETIPPAEGTLTNATYLPTFFIASYDDSLQDLSDPKFDGYLYSIRKAAIPYGAGVILSHAKSLLPIIISCAMREQIQEELWTKVCERNDYFIPPSWDSNEKVEASEREEVEDKVEEEKTVEEKTVQEWQSFLEDLSKLPREAASPSPRKRQAPKQSDATSEQDFLSQFE